jgi:stage V sporulation protein R
MGYSKVYEIILNNDPAYAFLLETNKEIDNIMVMAHCIGHSYVFKYNYMFEPTDRNMVNQAATRATRIENYIDEFGIERVEKVMDAAFSISRHIDPRKGIFREKYPSPEIKEIRHKKGDYDDLLNNSKMSIEHQRVGYDIPPYPEKDLLWFIINYGRLEKWEKDIVEIIREESYYFYPQHLTKILNEGFAVFTHIEIMHQLNLTGEEMINFACTHEKVVQPGANPYRINPYYLGIKILQDIDRTEGRTKMLEVVKNENDISLIRNYLSKELVKELGLFSYGYKCEENHKKNQKCNKCDLIEVKDKDLNQIVNNITRSMVNYGAPELAIIKLNGDLLTIKHMNTDSGPLDLKYAERTMELIFYLWAGGIEIETVDDDNKSIVLAFDEAGFSILDE